MIELTARDGQKIGINPIAIWHIWKGSGEQTAIYVVTGGQSSYLNLMPRCSLVAVSAGYLTIRTPTDP